MGFCIGNNIKTISLSLLVAIFGILFLYHPAHAAINPQINFQGKLTNPDNTNVANGTYSIVFSLYTVSSGGANIWTETQGSVSVTDGVFQVALGSVTALPGSVDFNTASIFLGIKVGADAEMTPRIQFTAAPYAFNSDKVGGISASGFVQLGLSSAQVDVAANPSIFINKTAAGNLLQLQASASNVLTLSSAGAFNLVGSLTTSSGAVSLGGNAASSLTTSSGALTITSAAATTWSTTAGNLTIQAGSGTVSLGSSTVLTAAAGLSITSTTTSAITLDSGTTGAVNVGTSSNAKTITIGNTTGATAIAHLVGAGTNVFNIQGASSAIYMQLDTTNNRLYIGNPVGDATGILLVLDTKNTTGDPVTGVSGSMYYNSVLGKMRCYENVLWTDCDTNSGPRVKSFMKQATIGATTHTGVGLTVPTVSATASSSPQAEANYVAFTTTGGANNISGYATGAFTATQLRYAPVLMTRVRTGAAITTTRLWVGLSSAAISGQSPVIGAAAFVAAAYTAVGFDPAVNAGNWVCGSGDGANHSGVDTGVAVAINSYYDIVVDYYSVTSTLSCAVSANGGAYTTVTKTTNLPAVATSLGINALVNNTTSGAARALSVATLSLEQN